MTNSCGCGYDQRRGSEPGCDATLHVTRARCDVTLGGCVTSPLTVWQWHQLLQLGDADDAAADAGAGVPRRAAQLVAALAQVVLVSVTLWRGHSGVSWVGAGVITSQTGPGVAQYQRVTQDERYTGQPDKKVRISNTRLANNGYVQNKLLFE